MPAPAWLDPQNWTWKVAVGAVAVAVVALILLGVFAGENEDEFDRYFDEHYDQWRAECQLYATSEVAGSPVYEIGGKHWADLVNDCITDKAVDQSP